MNVYTINPNIGVKYVTSMLLITNVLNIKYINTGVINVIRRAIYATNINVLNIGVSNAVLIYPV
jgi:hypothetical protein